MNLGYKTLADIGDIANKRVLVRFDFNVPINKDGNVVDDYRIQKSLPTLNVLLEKKAKVIIISHIEGESDSLRPVFNYLKETLRLPITFCEDCIENGQSQTRELEDGHIILCENLRLYDGEKKNDEAFSKKLAALGDYYVNDAFSVSHRKHASVVGVTKFLPSFAGLQLQAEIENLSQAFNPPQPFLFILGGAKFDTKIPLVEKFLPLASTIFIGGALANDFYKSEGLNVGKSLVSEENLDLKNLIVNPKILTPIDVVVNSSRGKFEKKPDGLQDDESILDVGTESINLLGQRIKEAKCILWNGPLGNYENGFTEATEAIAKMIGEHQCLSLVGGGDTLAAISKVGMLEKFSFVSTGGGAMLNFLAEGTLPGIEALKKKK